jgi:hypothetical protein
MTGLKFMSLPETGGVEAVAAYARNNPASSNVSATIECDLLLTGLAEVRDFAFEMGLRTHLKER